MDHPLRAQSPRPWRSTALIAVVVASVELALIVAVGLYLFGKFFADEVARATDPAEVAKAVVEREGLLPKSGAGKAGKKPLLTRRETSVLVLNGNGIAGAAAAVATRVQRRNYVVAGTGNASRTSFSRSVVMHRPGLEREAKRLAVDLGVRRVAPLDGMRKRELQGAHLALVVGG